MTRAELTSVIELRREVANATSRLDLTKFVAGDEPSKDFAALIHEYESKLTDLNERLDEQAHWLTSQLSAAFADDSLRLRVAKLHYVDGLNFSAVGRTLYYSKQYIRDIVRAVEKILVAK